MELDELMKYILWIALMIVIAGGLIITLKKMGIV
jgi:hypothetical protein